MEGDRRSGVRRGRGRGAVDERVRWGRDRATSAQQGDRECSGAERDDGSPQAGGGGLHWGLDSGCSEGDSSSCQENSVSSQPELLALPRLLGRVPREIGQTPGEIRVGLSSLGPTVPPNEHEGGGGGEDGDGAERRELAPARPPTVGSHRVDTTRRQGGGMAAEELGERLERLGPVLTAGLDVRVLAELVPADDADRVGLGPSRRRRTRSGASRRRGGRRSWCHRRAGRRSPAAAGAIQSPPSACTAAAMASSLSW